MAYKPNELLGDVWPDDLVVWRYMDLGKFISILARRELFFVRLGILAQSADFYEGAFPQLNFDRPELAAEQLAERLNHPDNSPEMIEKFKKWAMESDTLTGLADSARRLVYVLCWHINPYESAAMWKLYLQGNEGIAVQSTVGRLKESLAPAPGEQWIQPVKYYDPQQHPVPADILQIPLWKRVSFMHEQELRVLAQEIEPEKLYPAVTSVGIYVPCAIETLIERVFVAPTTEDFVREAVQRVLDRFGLDRQVIRSALDAGPGAPAVK